MAKKKKTQIANFENFFFVHIGELYVLVCDRKCFNKTQRFCRFSVIEMGVDGRTHHCSIRFRRFSIIYTKIMRFFDGFTTDITAKNIFDTIDTSESKTHTILVLSDGKMNLECGTHEIS